MNLYLLKIVNHNKLYKFWRINYKLYLYRVRIYSQALRRSTTINILIKVQS